MTNTVPPIDVLVHVPDEKRGFRVQARNDRFAVCTKQHFSTVRYFILDAESGVRGTENLVLGFGAETKEQCEEMLARLSSGETEVSHRNRVPWDVVVNERHAKLVELTRLTEEVGGYDD